MIVHNFDPVFIDFGIIQIRWYSLAYIFGILIGWWYGKILLNFAINKAKKIGITPLILQTNSLDHPNALMFYQKNGFQVFSRRDTKVIKSHIENEKIYK